MNEDYTHGGKYCGGKTKSGGRCKRSPAIGGNGRCKLHNAFAKRGMEAPNYRHGKYSKYLPNQFIEAYKNAQSDEQLLSVRDEIALSDAMLMAMLPTLDTGESGEAWKQLGKIVSALKIAYYAEDSPGMAHGIDAIIQLTNSQITHYETHDAINKQVDHRRKLVDTETKISTAGERAISVGLFTMTIGAILQLVESCFKEYEHERGLFASQIRDVIQVDTR